MRRTLIDRLTRLLGWIRRNRRLPAPDGPVNLNLGSSLIVAEGWINLDGALSSIFAGCPKGLLRVAYRLAGVGAMMSEEEYVAILSTHRFVHHDLRYGVPFPDECADTVFSSHTLEHLSREDGAALVGESLRVLKPGGIVHISVPDLGAIIDRFSEGRRFEATDQLFEDLELGDYARHRYMYDEAMLRELLETAGFADVRRWGHQEGEVPDLDVIDQRPWSLVLEARKPAP